MKLLNKNITGVTMAVKEFGFTLIEVLVTIVILSIGLLGVASLQLNSLKGNQSALESSVAAALAMEGADRVRANLPAIRDPESGNIVSSPEYLLMDSAGSDPDCIDTGCTKEQLAQTDAFQWISSIKQQLPNGVGVICRDSTPNDGKGGSLNEPWDPMCDKNAGTEIWAVKIAWDHDRDPSTPYLVYRMSLIP